MKKKPFVAQTSMVPILACVAALLFSANFYQFMQKNFKKWWGWDFTCPVEQVECNEMHMQYAPGMERHEHHRHHHRKYRHHHRKHRHHQHEHQHEVQERRTIILDVESDLDLDLQDAERKLERNLERALGDLERLHERMEWDADVDIDVERLETEIRIKLENLEDLESKIRVLRNDNADEIIREYQFGDNNTIKIRVQDHR